MNRPRLATRHQSNIFWNDDKSMLEDRDRTAQRIRKIRKVLRTVKAQLEQEKSK